MREPLSVTRPTRAKTSTCLKKCECGLVRHLRGTEHGARSTTEHGGARSCAAFECWTETDRDGQGGRMQSDVGPAAWPLLGRCLARLSVRSGLVGLGSGQVGLRSARSAAVCSVTCSRAGPGHVSHTVYLSSHIPCS